MAHAVEKQPAATDDAAAAAPADTENADTAAATPAPAATDTSQSPLSGTESEPLTGYTALHMAARFDAYACLCVILSQRHAERERQRRAALMRSQRLQRRQTDTNATDDADNDESEAAAEEAPAATDAPADASAETPATDAKPAFPTPLQTALRHKRARAVAALLTFEFGLNPQYKPVAQEKARRRTPFLFLCFYSV